MCMNVHRTRLKWRPFVCVCVCVTRDSSRLKEPIHHKQPNVGHFDHFRGHFVQQMSHFSYVH